MGTGIQTHGIEAHVMKGRIWSDTATRQGRSRVAGSSQRLGERHATDSPQSPQKEPSLPSP